MNKLFDEINTLKHLFLVDLEEPEDNQLLITIKAATISENKENISIGAKIIGPVRKITSTESGKQYRVLFKSYVAYFVVDESFYLYKENEESTGQLFRIFSKSNYLDFLRDNTIAEYIRDGKIAHYSISCLNHVINIGSMDKPIISRK